MANSNNPNKVDYPTIGSDNQQTTSNSKKVFSISKENLFCFLQPYIVHKRGKGRVIIKKRSDTMMHPSNDHCNTKQKKTTTETNEDTYINSFRSKNKT
jgi:hypothetical protein